ncbi:hypothetical protein F5Y01DRAFT_97760 [Xylaria sp. FL0043]|nr:hypothetical protein F5Y01DRAFT_97760 [Xylaria sp. FL0043]
MKFLSLLTLFYSSSALAATDLALVSRDPKCPKTDGTEMIRSSRITRQQVSASAILELATGTKALRPALVLMAIAKR